MDVIFFFLSQHIKLYSVSLSNFLSSGRTTFRTNYQHSGPFHTTNQPHKAIYFYQPLWGSAYWVAVYGTRVIICVAAENLSHIFQLASLVDTSLWKQLKAAARPRWTASRHTNTHTHYRLGAAQPANIFQIKNVDSKYNALYQKMHITDRTDLFYLLHEAIRYCI